MHIKYQKPNLTVFRIEIKDVIVTSSILNVGLIYKLNETKTNLYVYYKKNKRIKSIVMPKELNGLPITAIGAGAFASNDEVHSIIISNSVTVIEDVAFFGCHKLTDLTIPNSVTQIGEYAFAYCKSLNFITFLGSAKQWESIKKGNNIYYYSSIKTINCLDGVINL